MLDPQFAEWFSCFQTSAGQGRKDLTDEDVKSLPVYSYLIAYRPGTRPLQVASILPGRRDADQGPLSKQHARREQGAPVAINECVCGLGTTSGQPPMRERPHQSLLRGIAVVAGTTWKEIRAGATAEARTTTEAGAATEARTTTKAGTTTEARTTAKTGTAKARATETRLGSVGARAD